MDRVFSFLLWPKREAGGPWKQGRKKQGRKKRGSITWRTDRANEANKMFIIWLCWLFRFWKGDGELEVHTATYGPGIDQSQHAKSVSHIISCSYYWFCINLPLLYPVLNPVVYYIFNLKYRQGFRELLCGPWPCINKCFQPSVPPQGESNVENIGKWIMPRRISNSKNINSVIFSLWKQFFKPRGDNILYLQCWVLIKV